ncbi:hypothetical protein XENTR_v10002690 [Xenopus tropicalis]|nr:hypothetical protein XENTR_v10002690 [Xenopus tropicalis]
MDDLDIPSKTTRLQNTLIQYHCMLEEEWCFAKKSSGVTAWRKPSEEFGGCLYKIEGIVEDDYNRIVDYIRPGPYRLQWDSLMTSMDIIKEFSKECCVMRYTTAGQLLNIISPREFVDFSYTTQYEDGLLTCGTYSHVFLYPAQTANTELFIYQLHMGKSSGLNLDPS